jgi:hypothetical protein
MSYDLMVFNPESAPKDRKSFQEWYDFQTKWSENHGYNDPVVTSKELRNWFMEIIESFPAMNGPFAGEDISDEDETLTDYCIGKDVIYVTFAWSVAEQAYESVRKLALKYKVGFYDVSSDDREILFPENYK